MSASAGGAAPPAAPPAAAAADQPFIPNEIIKFDPEAFQDLLKTSKFGRFLLVLASTTSTMNDMKAACEKNAPAGNTILAEEQTAGRGSVVGRVWESAPCQNLLFTFIVRKSDTVMKLLPIKVGIAMTEACRQEGVNAWLKWPNDVWIGDKKIAGMLIEDLGKHFSIGVGINVNQIFTHDDDKAKGSLRQALRRAYGDDFEVSRERVLANFFNIFAKLLQADSEAVLDRFKRLEKLRGRTITVTPKPIDGVQQGAAFTATVVDYSPDGCIIIRREGQADATLPSGDVSVRGDDIHDLVDKPLLRCDPVDALLLGKWQNQLGSIMEFTATANGVICGSYHTAVGNARTDHPLHGCWTSLSDGGAVLGFSVAWKHIIPGKIPSATAWSGRLYFDRETGETSLSTTWTLVTGLPKSDEWKATTVNRDIFKKLP